MTLFNAETLDLSRLGAPTLVEVDYAASKARLVAELLRLWKEARTRDPSLPEFDVAQLETDPAIILSEEFAFGDTLLRQAINDAANALRLATAVGDDLGHIAKTYHNTNRLVLDAGDPAAIPPRNPVYEGDTEYRARAQLAPEAYPLYGLTPGGYIYRTRRLFGHVIKDVRPLRLGGGRIDLIVLARAGDGSVAPQIIGDIQLAFDGEADSESTDILTVRAAAIVTTPVRVTLGVPRGPASAPLIAAATEAIAKLGAERHAIGETLHVQAIGAVAKVGPARWARVEAPLADVIGSADGAPWISGIEIETEVDG